MTKPPKTPRPQKPPIIHLNPEDEDVDPTVGLIHERYVGRVVIEWAKLEGCMVDTVHRLLQVEFEYGRHLTARLDATALIKLMRELGQMRLPEAKFHKLFVICDKIDIRRDDRNLIVHGSWGRAAGSSIPYAMSLRIKTEDPSKIISETFPRQRMLEIIADIRSLKSQLVELLNLSGTPNEPSGQPVEA